MHVTSETQVVHPGGVWGRKWAAGSRKAAQKPFTDFSQLLPVVWKQLF